MKKSISRFGIILVILLLSACSRADEQTPIAESESAPTATLQVPSATPTSAPTDTPTPSAPQEPTPAPPTETPVVVEPAPDTAVSAPDITGLVSLDNEFPSLGEILPTATPLPNGDFVSVGDLGIGEADHYVNVNFGYELRYPADWFTGFGNRPVLVSFSNLDPGTTNRDSMRAAGCLIEISSSANTYSFNLASFRAQSPQTYEGAQETELGGIPALLLVRQNTGQIFHSELLQIIAHDHLFLLTLEYAQDQEATCRPVWDDIRSSWRWFEADLISYKNPTFGYSISHPRRWFLYNQTEQGTFVSSVDPSTVAAMQDILLQGMVIHTHVFENPEFLPLKEFLVKKISNLGLTNDIDLGNILGVRSITTGPLGSQAMIGYFQGPLGRIYVIEALYPPDRAREFRPIANAIIYSFDF